MYDATNVCNTTKINERRNMAMKYNCELIQDLLPLYHDKALSEVSNKVVEEHVQTCALCKAYSEDIESNVEQLGEASKPLI